MKITLTDEVEGYLDEAFEIADQNYEASELINFYLGDDHQSELTEILSIKKNANLSDEEAWMSRFSKLSGEEGYAETALLLQDDNGLIAHSLNKTEYESNPYYKLLKGLSYVKGDITLGERVYEPYEGFLSDEIHSSANREISPIGFFKDGFKAPAIKKGKRIWMSLIPHEINTMKKGIEEAHGNVLTFGLGLGYFAFMASEKDDVKKVTVVENDPLIINLFKKLLLPLFPNKEKIEIIETDAFKFIEEKDLCKYDYSYVDLYHDEVDGLPIYLKFEKLASKKNLHFEYWIGGSILVYLRRYIIALLDMELEGETFNEDNEENKLLKKLHLYYLDKEIKTVQDIDYLLSDVGLKELARNL